MNNFKLASALLRDAWLIDPQWVAKNETLIINLLTGTTTNFQEKQTPIVAVNTSSPERFNSKFEDAPEGSVAVISIDDPITKYDSFCTYGTISFNAMLTAANNNPNIIGTVFILDSPGGQASGTAIFAEAINKSSKPTVGLIQGQACSAGYWIVSACNYVFVSHATDIVGSVGAFISYTDTSEYFKKAGIKRMDVYSSLSTEKNIEFREAILNNNTKPTELQLDYLVVKFQEAVKVYREGKLTSAKWEKGAVFNGEEAITIGLVDEFGSLMDAVNKVVELANNSNSDMSLFNRYPKLHAMRDVATENVTEQQLDEINAELKTNGVNSVVAVSPSVITEAQSNADALATAKAKITEQENKITSLTTELTTAQTDRDRFKTLSEQYGAQPGAVKTTPHKTEEKMEGTGVEADFYSETDAQLDQLLKN